MSATTPECVLQSACELGEGPVWRDGAVWFVDIKGLRIHCYEPETGAAFSWMAPAQPGFIAPTATGGWIAGLKTGLHRFDSRTGRFELFEQVVMRDHTDRRGRSAHGRLDSITLCTSSLASPICSSTSAISNVGLPGVRALWQ